MAITTFEAIQQCVFHIEHTAHRMGFRVDRGEIFCNAEGGQFYIFPKSVKKRGYVYTYNGEEVPSEEVTKYKPEELESQQVWASEDVMYGQYIQGREGARLVVIYPQLLTRVKEDGSIVLGNEERERQQIYMHHLRLNPFIVVRDIVNGLKPETYKRVITDRMVFDKSLPLDELHEYEVDRLVRIHKLNKQQGTNIYKEAAQELDKLAKENKKIDK